MARVTVEDCRLQVKNRFELVIFAAQRAKDIAFGSPLLLDKDKDKPTVIALREIAAGLIKIDLLKESIVKQSQKKQIIALDDQPEAHDGDIDEIRTEMANYTHNNVKVSKLYQDDEDNEDELDQ